MTKLGKSRWRIPVFALYFALVSASGQGDDASTHGQIKKTVDRLFEENIRQGTSTISPGIQAGYESWRFSCIGLIGGPDAVRLVGDNGAFLYIPGAGYRGRALAQSDAGKRHRFVSKEDC